MPKRLSRRDLGQPKKGKKRRMGYLGKLGEGGSVLGASLRRLALPSARLIDYAFLVAGRKPHKGHQNAPK